MENESDDDRTFGALRAASRPAPYLVIRWMAAIYGTAEIRVVASDNASTSDERSIPVADPEHRPGDPISESLRQTDRRRGDRDEPEHAAPALPRVRIARRDLRRPRRHGVALGARADRWSGGSTTWTAIDRSRAAADRVALVRGVTRPANTGNHRSGRMWWSSVRAQIFDSRQSAILPMPVMRGMLGSSASTVSRVTGTVVAMPRSLFPARRNHAETKHERDPGTVQGGWAFTTSIFATPIPQQARGDVTSSTFRQASRRLPPRNVLARC